MPNKRYPLGDQALLEQTMSLRDEDVCVMLLREGCAFDEQHASLADVADWDNGRSEPLADKSFARGVFDAADTELRARRAVPCAALVVFVRRASDADSRLVLYVDEGDLPFTPAAGQRVPIAWDEGPDRIFRL